MSDFTKEGESEYRYLIHKIETEGNAAQQGLSGLAMKAPHWMIEKAMERFTRTLSLETITLRELEQKVEAFYREWQLQWQHNRETVERDTSAEC